MYRPVVTTLPPHRQASEGSWSSKACLVFFLRNRATPEGTSVQAWPAGQPERNERGEKKTTGPQRQPPHWSGNAASLPPFYLRGVTRWLLGRHSKVAVPRPPGGVAPGNLVVDGGAWTLDSRHRLPRLVLKGKLMEKDFSSSRRLLFCFSFSH